MIKKVFERTQAIRLRSEGMTYAEIMQKIPVSKSTLSLWLRSVGLSKKQKQKISTKKLIGQQKGAEARRLNRQSETAKIFKLCKNDIKKITKNELFLIGVVLYWAEGAKQSDNRTSTMIDFANSDPEMIKIFIKWLKNFGKVKNSDILLRLHIHEVYRGDEERIRKFWSKLTGIPVCQFSKTNYKKHVSKVNRIYSHKYNGLVAVRVKKSTILNRRILGWIYAIIATQNNCPIV